MSWRERPPAIAAHRVARVLAFLAALPAMLLAASLVTLTPPTAQADLGGFTIERFHTDLTVRASGKLLVEERIEVNFTEPRRGIYRDIPVRYTDPKGMAWSIRFRLLEVIDANDRAYQTKVRSIGRAVRLRIGDPDRTLRGTQVYRIRYEIGNGLRRFPEHDELYWNATGNDWNTSIRQASAAVWLPVPFEADSLLAVAYAGHTGSREQPVEIHLEAPGVLRYAMTRSLQPREGLTVVAAWPPGAVRFPGRAVRALGFLRDNWIVTLPVLFFLWLLRRYRAAGRDPGPFSVAVRYEAPPGLSPGGAGVLVDEKVDLRDVTATIVDLAVRGHLTIRDAKKELLWGLVSSNETTFERQPAPSGETLLPHERQVLDGLFEGGDMVRTSDLTNKFYKKLPAIHTALYERLVGQGLFAGNPRRIRQRYVGAGFGMGASTVLVGYTWIQWSGGIMPHAMIPVIVAAIVTFALFVAFAPAMPRRTHAGARLRAWALGFQEFTDRVERPKLEMEEARRVFERLLPYALALGVATKWARHFEGIYAERPPSWYVGSHATRGFSTRAFEQSLSSSMTRVGQSMASSPRSSGSGGGGSSGGGGGGGGGGSW